MYRYFLQGLRVGVISNLFLLWASLTFVNISNDLFLVYYTYLNKGLSPDIKLREKINDLSKKISDREKELKISFDINQSMKAAKIIIDKDFK